MRVHITGCNGFIAQHLVRELDDNGHTVTGSDTGWAFNPEDMLDVQLPKLPDVVVHAGALVGRERGNAPHAIQYNVESTLRWARACRERDVRMLYLSSSEAAVPLNLYGWTKLWGEQAAQLELAEAVLIARLSMPYGPGHHPGNGRAALTNFLDLARKGETLIVHASTARSWCWVGDTVAGIRLLLELWPTQYWRYNVGRDDNLTPMLQVAEMAIQATRSHSSIAIIPPPPDVTKVKRLDCEPLQALGWAPSVELAEGMERTLRWLESLDRDLQTTG